MKKRTLLSGRKVRQLENEFPMTISSKCPDKWLFVDLETGDIWHVRDGVEIEKQDARFWRRANEDELLDLYQAYGNCYREMVKQNSRKFLKK